jgi:TetR/AcrR family acrAB operon transcriptional repressor
MSAKSSPSRQEEMSAESRRRLRDAAVRLFAERGYRETSLQDVGQAAGISRGSVSWHFGSKAGLLEDIVSQTIEQTLGLLEAIADDDSTPLGDWLAMYRDLIQHDPTARLFPMLLLEAIGPRSEIRETYAEFHRRIRSWIARRLTVAQARGELVDGLDPSSAAAALWAALVGAHVQWRLDEHLDLAPVFSALELLYLGKEAAELEPSPAASRPGKSR